MLNPPLLDSETIPLARTDAEPADVAPADDGDDTRPPRRRSTAERWLIEPPRVVLVLGGLLLFCLGFLLRACV